MIMYTFSYVCTKHFQSSVDVKYGSIEYCALPNITDNLPIKYSSDIREIYTCFKHLAISIHLSRLVSNSTHIIVIVLLQCP